MKIKRRVQEGGDIRRGGWREEEDEEERKYGKGEKEGRGKVLGRRRGTGSIEVS